MQILIVYDSVFGNTAKIAAAIAGALRASLGEDSTVDLLQAGQANPFQYAGVDLRVIGSPTRIANRLKKAGAVLAVPPEGFYVADIEGPLMDGELERAAAWARSLLQ